MYLDRWGRMCIQCGSVWGHAESSPNDAGS